jgi:membrane-associated phospholipid phosphatase
MCPAGGSGPVKGIAPREAAGQAPRPRRLRYGPPLLPSSARSPAAWLVVCCAVLVVAGGVLFAHQSSADGFDSAADSPVLRALGAHTGLLVRLATPGTREGAAALSAAVIVGCLLARRLNGALLGLLAVPVAVGVCDGLIKPLAHRTYLGSLAYPSGHTTAVVAVAATVTLLLAGPGARVPRVVRVLVPAAAVCLSCVVAVAVIGLRWHYFTDTVAGAAIGIGTVCGLALLLDLPVVRRRLAVTR